MDDWQLLNEYATRNSEEAFRTLVDRHAGIVYHAALRQTGNPHAAQEVTQGVFIALAQKAGRLPRQTVLCGWLYRATRFAVINRMRDEACRRRHEKEAMIMKNTVEPEGGESVWEQISPHLDDAIERLSKGDREVVMIRFFANKSHKEVAQLLGVSEDTARKRVSRALEKLRCLFKRRGVAVSSMALLAALSACGAQAAPTGLTYAVTAAAVAKGTTSSLTIANGILRLMAWAKAKTALLIGSGVIITAAATSLVVIKATGNTMDDLIAKLERESGSRIVCDRRLSLPAPVELNNLSLEQALDELSVQTGGYWSIDYAVYDSDRALRQLLEGLHEGNELGMCGWTNLNNGPLQASLIVAPYDPHGRSRTFLRMPKGRKNLVGMIVSPGPDAPGKLGEELAEYEQRRKDGASPSGTETFKTTRQTIYDAMRDGVDEGVLVPERLLVEIPLARKLEVAFPVAVSAETAARLAKAAQAHWAIIYTLRKSPVDGAGIKLIHAGMESMYGPTNLPTNPAAMLPQMKPRYNLTPEERTAHDQAVKAMKSKQ